MDQQVKNTQPLRQAWGKIKCQLKIANLEKRATDAMKRNTKEVSTDEVRFLLQRHHRHRAGDFTDSESESDDRMSYTHQLGVHQQQTQPQPQQPQPQPQQPHPQNQPPEQTQPPHQSSEHRVDFDYDPADEPSSLADPMTTNENTNTNTNTNNHQLKSRSRSRDQQIVKREQDGFTLTLVKKN